MVAATSTRTTRYGLQASALVLVVTVGAACGQAPAVDRPLLATAQGMWREYEQVARQWSLRVRVDATAVDKGKVTYTTVDVATVRGNGRCLLIEGTNGDGGRTPEDKPQVCHVFGAGYEFRGRRSTGRDGWALTEVTTPADYESLVARKELPADRLTDRDRVEAEYQLVGVAVDALLVGRMTAHPACRTERFAATAAGDGKPVEWRFVFDATKWPDKRSQPKSLLSGSAVFDPARGWVLTESKTRSTNGRGGITLIRRTFTYRTDPQGVPVPTEVTSELTTEDGGYTNTATTRFELLPDRPPADDAFTLTAYGLPESAAALKDLPYKVANGLAQPVVGTPPTAAGIGWYWWLAVAGIGLLAVGIGLRVVSSAFVRRR